jgi:hypothetical protein
MAARRTLTLSPSSPISAAALYTRLRQPSTVRTAPDPKRGSAARPSTSARTASSVKSSPWPVMDTWIPAESRPRTSSRSMAARATWMDHQPSRAPGPSGSGGDPSGSRATTARAVPSRSRSIAHQASLRAISSALTRSCAGGSRSRAPLSICVSNRDKAAPIRSVSAAMRLTVSGAASRLRRPGVPRRTRSTSCRLERADPRRIRPASSAAGEASSSTTPSRAARIWLGSGAGRDDGWRRTATIPHMEPGYRSEGLPIRTRAARLVYPPAMLRTASTPNTTLDPIGEPGPG